MNKIHLTLRLLKVFLTKKPLKGHKDDQINHQPTKESLENNTETSVNITESLVPETLQSQHASISSYLVAQDRWLQNQHIELVNIIGDPSKGMLTRSMAAKLTSASANECLFADFLFEIEPKKAPVSHPSPEAVKAELAKLVENPILLDRIPVLKTTFPVAWRILLSNKSRQKYVSYPRFVSYALEVLLGSNYTQDESFGSSPNILSNSKVLNGPFKVTPIELTAFMVVVNNNEKSVTPLPFTVKKKKEKSQTVTSTLPQTHGPETSGSL
ncbi:hypothetical protein Tco_0150792 [Tanacetum coccineum]